jgi:hypothetical protein
MGSPAHGSRNRWPLGRHHPILHEQQLEVKRLVIFGGMVP